MWFVKVDQYKGCGKVATLGEGDSLEEDISPMAYFSQQEPQPGFFLTGPLDEAESRSARLLLGKALRRGSHGWEPVRSEEVSRYGY